MRLTHRADAEKAREEITALGEKARPLVKGVEALVHIMLQVTDYVMRFAPIAVFAAVTAAIAEQGPNIILTFGRFVGSFYLGTSISADGRYIAFSSVAANLVS